MIGKKKQRRFSVQVPERVYIALFKLSRDEATSLSTEVAKSVVERLKRKMYLLDSERKYL